MARLHFFIKSALTSDLAVTLPTCSVDAVGWLIGVVCGVGAITTWLVFVPRMRITTPPTDESVPHFFSLPTVPRTVGLFVATVALSLVLHQLAPWQWLLWVPYLAFGAPLVLVDALTTWLPKRLHYGVAATMVVGLGGLTAVDWRAAVAAVIGAAAAFGVFHLIWRLGSGLGYGDVRLAVLIGAVAGQAGMAMWITSLTAGIFIGALWALVHVARRRRRPQLPAHFPYGPALWLGPFAAAVFL